MEENNAVKQNDGAKETRILENMDIKNVPEATNGTEMALVQLLKEMKDDNDTQRKYIKKQLHIMQVCLVAVVVLAGIAIYAFFTVLPKIDTMVSETQNVLANAEKISKELADTDIAGMMKNVDELVVSSGKNMDDAMKQIMAIDIKSLNNSISDLHKVVQPLAKLLSFGKN